MRCLPMAAIVAAVSTTALTQFASAADQGRPVQKAPVYKAPPPPPAPINTWTGWYVGGNVGYSWGDAHTDLAGNGSMTQVTAITPFGFTGSNTTRLDGVIGGGQIGHNYQFSPNGVLGFEVDIHRNLWFSNG